MAKVDMTRHPWMTSSTQHTENQQKNGSNRIGDWPSIDSLNIPEGSKSGSVEYCDVQTL